MEYKRVVAVEMEGDWYVIPIELQAEFEDLVDLMDEAYLDDGSDECYNLNDEFNDKFGEYATGGDLNLTELYIKDGK